ncbi:MAG: 2Fe-2S iron-sulfur cluster-binding protein [Polyangiales bacterium]
MPTFKLDGREIPFEPGDTIMRAAWRQGIEIPHYCWHPGLSVAANCRMCLVEIKAERPMLMPTLKWDPAKNEYVPADKPKLTPACQAPAAEGQEVFAKSAQALNAQSHVQEFLLLNHPVDCPICDQAGECKLQDYWATSQGKAKRKRSEPVHKPKAVRFGPTIVYDAERCVMCTRCVRFCDEVTHDHVLDMRERGNKNEITVSPGRELNHRYTLMTEHVCPVGALTSRDFRFKARVWFLRTAKSVCSGCATGCNDHLDFDPRHNRIYRIRPRDNAQVNKFWMCDDGMLTYHALQENRVTGGSVRNGEVKTLSPDDALAIAGRNLASANGAKLAIVLSAQFSSEDNAVLARFGRDVLGAEHFYLGALGGWEGDDILRHPDNNPNRAGALAAAAAVTGNADQVRTLTDLLADAASGTIDGYIALAGPVAEDAAKLAPLRNLKTSLSFASHAGPLADLAKLIVPVTAFTETEGTFVNAKGLAQRFQRAVHPAPGVKPAWQALLELAKQLGKPLAWNGLAEVRSSLPPAAAREVRV